MTKRKSLFSGLRKSFLNNTPVYHLEKFFNVIRATAEEDYYTKAILKNSRN